MYYLSQSRSVENPDYIECIVYNGLVSSDLAVMPSSPAAITAHINVMAAHTSMVSSILKSCLGCSQLPKVCHRIYNTQIENDLRNVYEKDIPDDPDQFCLNYLAANGECPSGRTAELFKVLSVYRAMEVDCADSYTMVEYPDAERIGSTLSVDPSLVDRFGVLFAMGFLFSDKIYNLLDVHFANRYWKVQYLPNQY